MSVTIGDSELRTISGPGSGDILQTFSMTVGAGAKGAIVMWTSGAVGGTSPVVGADIGGVEFEEIVSVTNGLSSERQAGVWVCEDFTGKANNTISVDIVDSPSWYNLWVAILDADDDIVVSDFGSAIVSGGNTGGVSLDDDGIGAALGIACASGGGADFTEGSGQTTLWETEFFTLLDSHGSYESFTDGEETLEYFSNSNFVVAAVALVDFFVFVPPEFEDPFIPGEPHLC